MTDHLAVSLAGMVGTPTLVCLISYNLSCVTIITLPVHVPPSRTLAVWLQEGTVRKWDAESH